MKSKPGENFLSLQINFHPLAFMTAAKRKHAYVMMERLPTTLTSDDGMGKLFRTSRSHCKCSYAIYLAFAWKFTYELLSLQARSADPLPPPYLYIVKIENFHPILTPSLRVSSSSFFMRSFEDYCLFLNSFEMCPYLPS